ncbi:biotin transporter BioY [Methanobacterium petrolearium]|uniref:biotin transporter BioY n=1 Tax=Methanobacterium petrolearium TaxID=710190 RepID=UPI001AE67B7E|nr:biotin transporter BioY [Methanobacterium petrolearium]MBP1946336.1 biotin transport system substrate-specific component [Methanobacterium petrolearium]BDZ70648.1 biotin biosynthesis protein BioY [Methanobacterium petrolearium]
MEISIENYFRKRYSFFTWRSNTSLVNKVIMAFFMACVTGIMAQIVIPLPWTPVPITAQTFAVLMAGVVLGRWWGGLSQVMYLAVGLLGVPWFAGMTGGYSILLGSTGGYFLGFILTAFFMGYFTDKYVQSRNFRPMLGLLSVANFAFIYIPGLLGLGLWMYMVNGSFPTILTLLTMGLFPFILGDLVKIAGAAALTKAITPKKEY